MKIIVIGCGRFGQNLAEKLNADGNHVTVVDMNAAKEAFSEYLDEARLDSRQIYFVNQIVEYIVQNGMLTDMSVLQEAPFTDKGSIVEVFDDPSVWMGIKRVIDSINGNAKAS